MTTCPSFHVAVEDSEEYCEACGAELSPTVAAIEPPPAAGAAETFPMDTDLAGTASSCPACGG